MMTPEDEEKYRPFYRLFAEVERNAVTFGLNRGKFQAILTVIKMRGLPLAQEQWLRFRDCNDYELLGDWLSASVTADSVDAIFTRVADDRARIAAYEAELDRAKGARQKLHQEPSE